MKITTRATFDIETMQLESWEGYEYPDEGPVEKLGGGPGTEAKNAANASAALSAQQAKTSAEALAYQKQQMNLITGFGQSRLQGLPWMNAATDYLKGSQAQSWQPAYAALSRRYSQLGNGLPGGARMQSLQDLDAARARDFDSQAMGLQRENEASKYQAAALLTGQASNFNPLGWSQAAQTGYGNIMQLPPTSGIGGVLGGVAGAALGAAGNTKGGFGALF